MIEIPSADELIKQILEMPDDCVVVAGDHRMTVNEFREWLKTKPQFKGIAVYPPVQREESATR